LHPLTLPSDSFGVDKPMGETCDLCERPFVFVLTSGRSGSTTLLEGLNALPGVRLRGEMDHAVPQLMGVLGSADNRDGSIETLRIGDHYHAAGSWLPLLCGVQQIIVGLDPLEPTDPATTTLGFKEIYRRIIRFLGRLSRCSARGWASCSEPFRVQSTSSAFGAMLRRRRRHRIHFLERKRLDWMM
tara:strand:+ start:207 stop:764 length:558 start_codon:yes stop_codon:yes gene_type:complete